MGLATDIGFSVPKVPRHTIRFETTCPDCGLLMVSSWRGLGPSHAEWIKDAAESCSGVELVCRHCHLLRTVQPKNIRIFEE